jgi:hypothetical protein
MHEALEVETLPPLPVEEPVSRPATRHSALPTESPRPKIPAAFTRLTTVHPSLLGDLPTWWRRRARDNRVHATRRLVLDPPQDEGNGTWRISGCLRGPLLYRPIPIELHLWPRLGAWTKLNMTPQRRVHAGRRYFRVGNHALDALTELLNSELRRA